MLNVGSFVIEIIFFIFVKFCIIMLCITIVLKAIKIDIKNIKKFLLSVDISNPSYKYQKILSKKC
jgi:hypothetical protein